MRVISLVDILQEVKLRWLSGHNKLIFFLSQLMNWSVVNRHVRLSYSKTPALKRWVSWIRIPLSNKYLWIFFSQDSGGEQYSTDDIDEIQYLDLGSDQTKLFSPLCGSSATQDGERSVQPRRCVR